MPLRGKPLISITEGDLQALVDDQIRESKTIEYKQVLPGDQPSDKVKFLAGVSSFANAGGGDLVFGIAAKDGVPVNLCGLGNINDDEQRQRLVNTMGSGIQPRLLGVDSRAIPLSTKGSVAIIVRVSRSWALPQMVTFNDNFKFYTRNSVGKHPMDVGELRSAFTLASSTTDQIRRFRFGRLGQIVANETPAKLGSQPKVVLHLVPLGAFDPSSVVDLSILTRDTALMQAYAQRQLFTEGYGSRRNLDGVLTYGGHDESGNYESYVQFFRDGCIEAVDAELLTGMTIPSLTLELEILKTVPRYLQVCKLLRVEPPIMLALSLLGVSGYKMGLPPSYHMWPGDRLPIDRDQLMIPEIIIGSYADNPVKFMKPVFDALWNAAGLEGSFYYNGDGTRKQ